jgi:hypothetical protein
MKRFMFIVLGSLVAQTAWAGWVITYKDADTGETSHDYYDGDRASFGDMIDTGEHFIAVNRDARAYWMGTPEQYCKALISWTKNMQAKMASMPVQFRPVPISQKKVTRKKLGTEQIAGFSATGWEFYVNGNQEGRLWISSDSGLSDIIEFERSQSKRVKCLEELQSMGLEGSKLYKQTVDGAFVLKESYRQVVSVERKSISSSQFDAPEGYKAFQDYDRFVEYTGNHSDSSTTSSSDSPAPQLDSPERASDHGFEPESSKDYDGGDNVVINDAKEIGRDAADEAHQSTKQGIQEGISEDIQKGVRGLMDKLGF